MIRRNPTQSKFAILHVESFCCKTRIPHLIALRARDLCTPLIFLLARLAHCMHISDGNATCHHQSGSHIRKRCGTCFRALACKELFWRTPKEYMCCIVLFYDFKCCFVFCYDGKDIPGQGYSHLCGTSSGCCCCTAAFASGMADQTAIS